ncbi:MAG: sigma-70 family RNA polymerase sigma factor [Gemmatimonadota bacterium]
MKTDWEAVYRTTYREVVGFLAGLLLDHERAKDLAQEAFARVLGHEADNPRGLVFRTAANLARDEARMVVRRKRHLKLLKVEEGARADGVASPWKELESKERAEKVRAALETLSETDRQVLVLWNAGFDYGEIAERTGLSRGAIGTTVARAKAKLVRACSAEEGIDAAHG